MPRFGNLFSKREVYIIQITQDNYKKRAILSMKWEAVKRKIA